MGNYIPTSSCSSPNILEIKDKRNEIQRLCDLYPFGEVELKKLIHIYDALQSHFSSNSSLEVSFLTELALLCQISKNSSMEYETILKEMIPSYFDANLKMKLMQSKEEFLDGMSQSQRRGTRTAARFLFQCCSSTNAVEASTLVELSYRLSIAAVYLITGDDSYRISNQEFNLSFFKNMLLDFAAKEQELVPTFHTKATEELKEGEISLSTFTSFSETMPLFSAPLSTFLHSITFPEYKYPEHSTPFYYPRLSPDATSAFFSSPSSPLLFTLACTSASLSGQWYRLFSSDLDGISFNRLLNALLGYSGPTLLLIRNETGAVFGAYSDSPWKEGKDFYGGSDCFLFQLLPTFHVYRSRGTKRNFIYCNPHARSKGYDNLPHGIGFGGNYKQLRLFISETFDDNVVTNSDLTYDDGFLIPHDSKDSFYSSKKKHFEIESLEVFGVGGDAVVSQALKDRKLQRDIVEANIKKARKVDKAQFLDDFNSGLIESKAFKHRQQVHGHEVSCKEDEE